MPKVFIDSNILVYCADANETVKRSKARQAVKRLSGAENRPVISTQVLQEFYVAVTRKLGVAPLDAKAMFSSFAAMETVLVDVPLIKEAIDCSVINRISFWDALIVTSAETAQCSEIWTEDLNDGQTIRGVRIVNPLK